MSNELPGDEHVEMLLFNVTLSSSEEGGREDSAPFVSTFHSFAAPLAFKEKPVAL